MNVRDEILKALKASRTIVITSHVNPDGDAVGSSLAMYHVLRKLGKRPVLFLSSPPMERYRFLPGIKKFRTLPDGKQRTISCDTLLVLDCPELARIGGVRSAVNPKRIIMIDHHASHQKHGSLNWVDTRASATGELVYDFIVASGIRLDRSMGMALYTALATDTGFFSQENTTSKALRIAAHLVDIGIRPEKIVWEISGNRPIKHFLLETKVRGTVRLYRNGRVVTMDVKRPWILAYEGGSTDTNDFFGSVKMLKGVEIIVLLWERRPKEIKISFRSKNSYNVCRLAQQFGGGGHRLASGCTYHGTLAGAKKAILSKIKT